MIIAVCLNPALDVTYTVTELRPGTSHRVQAVHHRPGGKGVNVASVLHQQDVAAVVAGPIGGSIGNDLSTGLDDAGIEHRLTPIAASTRQTVTIVSEGDATVLNEPGPMVTGSEWTTFTGDFAAALEGADVVTMSGSLPNGVPTDAYGQLVTICRRAGVPVILDCEGPPLVAALPAGPDIVKINEHEAATSTGAPTDSVPGVIAAAEALRAEGAAEVVITRGADGTVAVTASGRYLVRPAEAVAGNPTGAGDAFTAGLAAATAAGSDWPTRLRRASAWAAAAVAMPTAGLLDQQIAADHETRTTALPLEVPPPLCSPEDFEGSPGSSSDNM